MNALLSPTFLLPLGITVCIYGLFSLGIQLNVGQTGVLNFGQVGFMGLGGYAFGIAVVDLRFPVLPAALVGLGCAAATAVVVGLVSLRLRTDYFAIATVAFSEIVRYSAQNARGLTAGNQGLTGYDSAWQDFSLTVVDSLGLPATYFPLALFLLALALLAVALVALGSLARTPWGRTLRAIREDEDAVRALGKNVVLYKVQSLVLSALLAATAGIVLALDLTILSPGSFETIVTFFGFAIVVLGGLGSYFGACLGSLIFWTLLESTRFLGLPIPDDRLAALRFLIVGAVLMALVAFRPHGLLGRREEMVIRG